MRDTREILTNSCRLRKERNLLDWRCVWWVPIPRSVVLIVFYGNARLHRRAAGKRNEIDFKEYIITEGVATAGFDRFFGSLSPIPAKEIFANKKSFRKFCPISTSETRQVSLLTVFRTPLHIKDFSDRAIAPTPMGPIRIDSGACKEELLAKEKSFLAFGATF